MNSFSSGAALAIAATVIAGACGNRPPVAYGNANSVIVIAPDSLWTEVGDSVLAALEPRVFTVRDERTFELTQVAPTAQEMPTLRQWKQVLAIGRADDPWVAPVLDGGRPVGPDRTAGASLVQRENIWARGQQVTALVVPPVAGAGAVIATLPDLHALLDAQFRRYVRGRMFVSGRNEALRDSLRERAGFGLLVPQVYRWEGGDSLFVFRNDQATAAPLVRSVLVTWRSGAADGLTPDTVLAWRDSLARQQYDPPQQIERSRIQSRPLEDHPAGSFEVQGAWTSLPGSWPAGGPFLNRVIACPEQDRIYLLDAWLYAPSKGKYEYVLQLETILDSFDCGAGRGDGDG